MRSNVEWPPMRELARTLTVADLSLLVVGTVIGSGIFLVPGAALRQSGGEPNVALFVWVLGGVLSVLGALTFGELGAMRPEAGGLYVHLREAFGPLAAFLYGWTLYFVMGSGSIATLAVAFSAYMGELLPMTPLGARAVAIAMITVVTVVNVLGTRPSARFQNAATALKIGALLAISAALFLRGPWEATPASSATGGASLAGLGAALVGVLWAYEGWQYATFSAGETRDPQRTFPLGIVLGTAVTVAVYLLANLAYLAALGPERVARSNRVAAEAMSATFGPAAGQLVALAILVSITSAANGLTLTAPRVYFAMARDGVFFRRLGEVHPRFGTPAIAVLGSAVWAVLLAATGTFEQLLTYVVFAGWGFYALGGLAVFHYRLRRPDLPRPFRVPGYPWTPILFVLASAGIVVSTFLTHPARGLLGTLMVLAGAPVFWLWKRNGATRVPGRGEG
jgi:APA family basic amino acid/polyamine antiporter